MAAVIGHVLHWGYGEIMAMRIDQIERYYEMAIDLSRANTQPSIDREHRG